VVLIYSPHQVGACHRILVLLSMLLPVPALAENDTFPDHPITMVMGFGVRGGTDKMTRAVSRYFAEEFGQPLQLLNKEGAGTLLTAKNLLSRPYDGYTIFASGFYLYLTNTVVLEGNADYSMDDFAYFNFQWFDEEMIAVYKDSKYYTGGVMVGLITIPAN
jgi:putative tricarboxylic transport membrane protein